MQTREEVRCHHQFTTTTTSSLVQTVRGHSLTTPTSAHLRSPLTYIHIPPLSVHSYTYYYSLPSPTSPTFGDVAVHIPFPLILIPYCTIPILHDSTTFSDLP